MRRNVGVQLLAAVALGLAQLSAGQDPQLQLQAVPEFDKYPGDSTVDVKAIVSIIAPEVDQERVDRGPVAVTCVVDRSGSMAGDPLELVKRSVEYVSSKLVSYDFFGLVSYSTAATEDVGLDTENGALVSQALEGIDAAGGTNLSGGLLLGVEQMADEGFPSYQPQDVFLFSDGVATVGTTEIGELGTQLGDALAGKSVKVSTFSFGEADTSFMSAIAEIGSGETYVIDSQDKIAEAFGLALAGLLTTIATEIKVTMTPVGGVSITELLHGGTEENGASGESPASITFYDLFGGERRDLFLVLSVPPGDSLEQEILQVEASYLSTLSPEPIIKRAAIFISREARPQTSVAVSAVVEAEVRLITSNALIACAEAETSAQRTEILAQARAEVEVIVETTGGNVEVNVNVYVEVLVVVQQQVVENTFKPAEVKLQAESIAQQRYVGAPAGDIVVPEVTPTAAQAAASADAAVFVESDMPAPEREEATAPPEDSVQTGDQTNPEAVMPGGYTGMTGTGTYGAEDPATTTGPGYGTEGASTSPGYGESSPSSYGSEPMTSGTYAGGDSRAVEAPEATGEYGGSAAPSSEYGGSAAPSGGYGGSAAPSGDYGGGAAPSGEAAPSDGGDASSSGYGSGGYGYGYGDDQNN